jgi:cellulose biosynthesis protein BcsQ
MKYLIVSIKGGVGKTGIAQNLATFLDAQCVTNDLVVNANSDIVQLEPKKRSIPVKFCARVPVVFDFGASYNSLDHKLAHAVKLSHAIIVPTFTDARSLQGTIDTVNLVKVADKPIAIIINNFTSETKFKQAKDYLIDALGELPIFGIRTTTLFERVAKDGSDWFSKVHQIKGEYQLNKTRIAHEQVYAAISTLGGK